MSNNLEYLGNLQDSDEIKWKFHSLPLSMVGTLISSENLSMLLTSLEAYSHSGYIGYLFEAMSAWSKYLDMTIEELFLRLGEYNSTVQEQAFQSSTCIDAVVAEVLMLNAYKDSAIENYEPAVNEVSWFLMHLYENHCYHQNCVDMEFATANDSVSEDTVSSEIPQSIVYTAQSPCSSAITSSNESNLQPVDEVIADDEF